MFELRKRERKEREEREREKEREREREREKERVIENYSFPFTAKAQTAVSRTRGRVFFAKYKTVSGILQSHARSLSRLLAGLSKYLLLHTRSPHFIGPETLRPFLLSLLYFLFSLSLLCIFRSSTMHVSLSLPISKSFYLYFCHSPLLFLVSLILSLHFVCLECFLKPS